MPSHADGAASLFKWGIGFEEEYVAEQHAARTVSYADRLMLEQEIMRRQMDDEREVYEEPSAPSGPPVSGGMGQGQVERRGRRGDQKTGSTVISDTTCYFPPVFIHSINPISSRMSSSDMK